MDEYNERERPGPDACAVFQHTLGQRLAGEEPGGSAAPEAGEHGAACGECAAFGRLIEALSATPALESPDLVRRVLASHEDGLRRRRVRLLALSSTAALAAAAALVFALIPGAPSEESATVVVARDLVAFAVERGAVRAVSPDGAGKTAPGEGQRVTADGGPALLRSDRSISIGLEAGATVAFLDLDGRAPVLALESGRAAFLVDPEAPPRVAIETAAGRVVVAGSGQRAASAGPAGSVVLMVEVAGAEVRIDVASGAVVFEIGDGIEGRREVAVTAGHGFGTDRPGLVPLEGDRRSVLLALLGLVQRDAAAEAEARAGQGAGQDQPLEAKDEPVGAEPERRQDRADQHGRPAGGDDQANREVSPDSSARSPGELIAMAREQRTAGNWNAAAGFYRQVLVQHPARPEATAVLVPLAEIELERLRRPDLALGHYGLYVGKLPGGPLGEEALHGKCLALRALGRMNEEAAALAEFLRRYPGSVRAPGVKTRLDILGEKIE